MDTVWCRVSLYDVSTEYDGEILSGFSRNAAIVRQLSMFHYRCTEMVCMRYCAT